MALRSRKLRKVDLNLLVTLEALLRHQNVTRAAAELCLSQPAVSQALGRLRTYFEDELLVSFGGRLVLTPLAMRLIDPVRSLLAQAEGLLAERSSFDPGTSNREFSLIGTDYLGTVLFAEVLQHLAAEAPNVAVVIEPLRRSNVRRFEHGEFDLCTGPAESLVADHPKEILLQDMYVCAVWVGNPLVGDQLTLDQYVSLKHIVWRGGPADLAWESRFLTQAGIKRRIARAAGSFTLIPQLLVGTEYVATLCSRMASYYARYLPIKILPAPLALPPFTEVLQWRRQSEADAGVRWLRQVLLDGARRLPTLLPESTPAGRAARPAQRHSGNL